MREWALACGVDRIRGADGQFGREDLLVGDAINKVIHNNAVADPTPIGRDLDAKQKFVTLILGVELQVAFLRHPGLW